MLGGRPALASRGLWKEDRPQPDAYLWKEMTVGGGAKASPRRCFAAIDKRRMYIAPGRGRQQSTLVHVGSGAAQFNEGKPRAHRICLQTGEANRASNKSQIREQGIGKRV